MWGNLTPPLLPLPLPPPLPPAPLLHLCVVSDDRHPSRASSPVGRITHGLYYERPVIHNRIMQVTQPYLIIIVLRRVWGDGKNFRRPSFLNEVLFRKKFHFHAQNFWWPFLVINHVFKIFPIFFLIFPIFTACNVVCNTVFTLFMLLRASVKHYFSKYWGDGCMGRPSTSIFFGAVPPVPP